MKDQLLYFSEAFVPTSFGFKEMIINEDASGPIKKIIVEGEYQTAGAKNKNNRVYTEELLNRETGRMFAQIRERGGIPQELDHPVPGETKEAMHLAQRVSLKEACGLIQHLEMQGTKVYGRSEIIEENDSGRTLAGLIRRNWKPAVSSRGLGGKPTQDPRGFFVIPESYQMVTYDFVSNPSNYNSVLSKFMEEQFYQAEEANKYVRKFWNVMMEQMK
jgi:hypothetical protein